MNEDWSWLIGEPNAIGILAFMGILLFFTKSKSCRIVGFIMFAIAVLKLLIEDGYIKV